MGNRVKEKVTLITGGADGIGAGTAKLFVEEGALVVIADIQEEPGQALVKELGDNSRFIKTDVTKEDNVSAAVDFAVSEFGRLDCIINNAGIVGAIGPIGNMPTEIWDYTIAVNLRGIFLGIKHAARIMVPQKSGCILNTASTAGLVGGLGPHAYTAAKHGVVGLTKSVSNELAPHGIRVNAIAPGNTVTSMTSSFIVGDPDKKDELAPALEMLSPLKIAGMPIDSAYSFLYLASDEARYVTGHTIVLDAGQTIGDQVCFAHQMESGIFREAGKKEL